MRSNLVIKKKDNAFGVSFVVPALNEEAGIADTVHKCFQVLEKVGITNGEVIVVDDGSTDGTARAAKEAGATVLSRLTNGGYGRALKTGIVAAANDTIVITDADGTYPISSVPDLLEAYYRGYDLVVGQRMGLSRLDNWYKSILRKALKVMVEKASGYNIPDINSGLRVFSKKRTMPFFNHFSDKFSFTTSQTIAYLMNCKQVLHLPIEYSERIGQSKVRLVKDSLRTLLQIVHLILYYKPSKVFIMMSFTCIVLGILGVLATVISGVKAGYILGLGALVVSILVFAMGLLAEQLRQLLLSNTRR